MMKAPPIPTSAASPVEFIPSTQDVETYRREKTRRISLQDQAIDRRAAALQKEMDAGNIEQEAHEAALAEIEQMRKDVADDRDITMRTIAFMEENYPSPQVFIVTVPTTIEREQINSRLIQLGLAQVTQEEIRATMVMELFNEDWTEPGEEPLDEHGQVTRAEDNANFLDSMWMRQEAHDAAIARWQEQEAERVEDEFAGAPAREPTPMPPKVISVRDQARLQLLIKRMMANSQKLRDLAASNMDFGRRNAVLLVRMHLTGVSGFEPPVPIERDPRTNALSEATVNALREVIADADWAELVEFIDRMYRIDGGEEKNLNSPLERPSVQDGLIAPSGGQANSDGSTEASSSTPVPDDGSAKIIEISSASTSGSSTAEESRDQNAFPTDVA